MSEEVQEGRGNTEQTGQPDTGLLGMMPIYEYFGLHPKEYFANDIKTKTARIQDLINRIYRPQHTGDVIKNIKDIEQRVGMGNHYGPDRLSKVYNYLRIVDRRLESERKLMNEVQSAHEELKAYETNA